MANVLKELQSAYRTRIKKIFRDHINSDIFTEIVTEFHLKDYRFDIAEPEDFDEILHLYCYQQLNRKKKERGIHFLLDVNITDLKHYQAPILKCLLETGRVMKISNQNNKIVSTNGLMDLVHDHFDYNSSYKYSKNFEHFVEICDELEEAQNKYYNDDEIYNKIVKVNKNIKVQTKSDLEEVYGKYYEMTFGGTLSDYSGKGLMLISMLTLGIIAAKLNYSKLVGITNTPSQMRKANMFSYTGNRIGAAFDYSNHIFKDGTTIKQYENKTIQKYNYTKEDVNLICKKIVFVKHDTAKMNRLFANNMKYIIKLALQSFKDKKKSKL
eukprot:420648_1